MLRTYETILAGVDPYFVAFADARENTAAGWRIELIRYLFL